MKTQLLILLIVSAGYLIESDYLYPIFAPNDLNETDRYSLGIMYPFIMR